MKIVKVKSEKTYQDKKGNERHYYNYYIDVAGKRIYFKPSFTRDYAILDFLANAENE